MPSNTRLIDSAGTAYYLSGPGTPYSGTGTPWTAQATSPIELSMNEKTGQSYTPKAPERVEIYGGGPPFRVGSDLISRGYGNVTEEFGLQVRGSTHDDAVAVVRLIKRVLKQATRTRPVVLAYQPNGATNVLYFEIYGGTMQESPSFTNEEAGVTPKLIRATVTWVRSPFGSHLKAAGTQPETLLSAYTIGNSPTTSPSNLVSMGTSGSGDLITEGSPTYIRMGQITTALNDAVIWLASVAARQTTALGGAASTTSTTGATLAAPSGITFSSISSNPLLQLMLFVRVASMDAIAQIRVEVLSTSGVLFYTSNWISRDSFATTGSLLYMGSVDFSRLVRSGFTVQLNFIIFIRSVTGGVANINATYIEYLEGDSICKIKGGVNILSTGDRMHLDQYQGITGSVTTPLAATAYVAASTKATSPAPSVLTGIAPLYISGRSLWIGWEGRSTGHSTSAQMALDLYHAPQYETLRGNG